jgi:hypothetical protein
MEGEGHAQESESARPNMCTGTGLGFVFIDRAWIEKLKSVHAHVNESSTGTRFIHVHLDRGDQPYGTGRWKQKTQNHH